MYIYIQNSYSNEILCSSVPNKVNLLIETRHKLQQSTNELRSFEVTKHGFSLQKTASVNMVLTTAKFRLTYI